MMKVTSIEKGIVIDHISSGKGLQIFQKLNLQESPHQVVLLMNVSSQRQGKKDIIKIQGATEINLNIVSLMDPFVTINVIENNSVTKKTVKVPQEVTGLFDCKNPRCITNHDVYATASFTLVSDENLAYQCSYCEEITKFSQK